MKARRPGRVNDGGSGGGDTGQIQETVQRTCQWIRCGTLKSSCRLRPEPMSKVVLFPIGEDEGI